jgi:hypothetical protein
LSSGQPPLWVASKTVRHLCVPSVGSPGIGLIFNYSRSISFCIGWYTVNRASRNQLISRETEILKITTKSHLFLPVAGTQCTQSCWCAILAPPFLSSQEMPWEFARKSHRPCCEFRVSHPNQGRVEKLSPVFIIDITLLCTCHHLGNFSISIVIIVWVGVDWERITVQALD